MSPWKILLLPLGVLLTALAYVATSLVGTAERPEVPDPIVLERSGDVAEPDEPEEPDEVVVVTPRPTAVRDDDGGAGDETDDSQDESDDTSDDSEAGDD